MESKVLRQEVLWVPEDRRVPIQSKEELSGANLRVWTLYLHTDPDVKPELPYIPQHQHNAFLEDYIHDWTHDRVRGCLRYGSRAMESKVWILVEHVERPARRRPVRRRQVRGT